MDKKPEKRQDKVGKRVKNALKTDRNMNFTEREWNKYKKRCEYLDKSNKDD